MSRPLYWLIACLLLGGCASTPPYEYHYQPGHSADLIDGQAVAPERAPQVVRRAIEAGNRIAGLPYRYGGGHRDLNDSAYDCSGAVSYVLRESGLLRGVMTSDEFRHYGAGGEGKWITLYAWDGHVFLVVADLRFDTGYGEGARGPAWHTRDRPARKAVLRHPRGL